MIPCHCGCHSLSRSDEILGTVEDGTHSAFSCPTTTEAWSCQYIRPSGSRDVDVRWARTGVTTTGVWESDLLSEADYLEWVQ